VTSPQIIRGPGRPKKGYYLASGLRVPGSTTITGRFKDSGGLIRWAHKEGQEGRELYEARDKAGEAGSIAHQWIEDLFHGAPHATKFPSASKETLAQAGIGFAAFKEWLEQVDLTILETEQPLISEEFKFGGTLDAIAIVGGKKVLLDWKTSGGTYPDYIAQVASYRQLVRERDGDDAPRSALLLRLGKEHADFHYHSWPESVLDMGWAWFQRALDMWELDKRLKKVAA
jgi:hypothetical protein